MAKRKVSPTTDPEDEIDDSALQDVVTADPEPEPEPLPHVAGVPVVYIAPDGAEQPATIAARFGTHSDLWLADGTLLESVRFDEGGAAGTYRRVEA